MPEQEKLTVSYSVGVKANIGNYESADVHLSKTEIWDVTDLKDGEVDDFYAARFGRIKDELSGLAETEYREMKG